jgi:hypothetical protein
MTSIQISLHTPRMYMQKNLTLISILTGFSLNAVTAHEMGFMYETKSADEFEDLESYLHYKIRECEGIADHPVNRVNNEQDFYRYVYFTGKAVAYRDCLNTSIN